MRREKVAVALVTHNRFHCLTQLLQSLKDSTYPIDSVWIVDNNSSDETAQKLPEIVAADPALNLIRLPENRGGAGGFRVAIESAYRSGADWVWIMDDDVVVMPDGLERLIGYRSQGLCLHGVRLQPNGQPLPFEQWMNLKTGFTRVVPDTSFKEGKKFCELNVGCFEGMLVHRSVVKQIGFPEPDFFLTEDDAFYGFLASQVTRVLYVNEVTMCRQLSRPERNFFFYRTYLSAPEHHLYYFVRNKFLMYRKLRQMGFAHPLWFAIRLGRYVTRVSLLYGVYELDLTKLKAILRAVWDGVRGEFGAREMKLVPAPVRAPSSGS